MVCSKSGKGHSISSSFISPWMTRKWWLGVNKEYFDRREHIYTRNLSKRENIEIERENEERKWRKKMKREKLWEIRMNQLSKYVWKSGKVFETHLYQFEQ
jgi:hypothetical protein